MDCGPWTLRPAAELCYAEGKDPVDSVCCYDVKIDNKTTSKLLFWKARLSGATRLYFHNSGVVRPSGDLEAGLGYVCYALSGVHLG